MSVLRDQEEESRKIAFELYGAGLTTAQVGSLFEKLYGRNYILRRGFLDGRAGLRIGYVSALETYWKYRELAKACKDKQE